MYDYDVLSIGAGTGGCAFSMRSADLGKKAGIIEYRKDGTGGTCMNRGCIPTKAMLQSAKVYDEIKNAMNYGIKAENIQVDMKVVQQKKTQAVMRLKYALENVVLRHRGIDRIEGKAKLLDGHTVEVINEKGETITLTAENILISTGSEPFTIPAFPIDGEKIITSNEALALEKVPENLIVIGAGAIGLEFADMYASFGSRVTIVEKKSHILPLLKDDEIISEIEDHFMNKGLRLLCDSGISEIRVKKDGKVSCELKNGEILTADVALVAIGRSINTKNIGLEELGIVCNEKGLIETDEQMRTSVGSIFAAGDITVGLQLAHKAQKQAFIAAEVAAGMDRSMSCCVMPIVIFTNPEIAMVGMTAMEASEKGIETIVDSLRYSSNEKAVLTQKTAGSIKVIARKDNHEIIGGFIFGESASVLVEEFAIAIDNGLTLEAVADSIHAHPTFGEVVMKVCRNAVEKALYEN